ncbi:nucleotidyl cyclase domain-containing protein [Mycolicibacterium confluentis]|uniref:Guanylate cyclase domain-containing protein n=1 Tax=Mycolicibacterium confluentis TaxID=28047 RepID=A0A7I7XYT4_9MYCO|nr:hypothetical protein MCNF_27280 [Mycolicibacterium confluentis]
MLATVISSPSTHTGHPLGSGALRDAGIHTGECELRDDRIAGIAVHIAARIVNLAGAGEILVSRTVRDLVAGSGTGFEDRGTVELRGVPGTTERRSVEPQRRRKWCGDDEGPVETGPDVVWCAILGLNQ